MYTIKFCFESGDPVIIDANPGEKLLDVARKANVAIDAPCSGNGVCGKCRVRLVSGYLDAPINRHISRMVYTKVVTNKSPWLQLTELGRTYVTPASHGEGRFVAPQEWIDKLFANGQVATQYADFNGNISMDEEWNVNGSYAAIEGITSPDGRCLGKMAHVERRGDAVAVNIYGEQDMKIFEAGVRYFK